MGVQAAHPGSRHDHLPARTGALVGVCAKLCVNACVWATKMAARQRGRASSRRIHLTAQAPAPFSFFAAPDATSASLRHRRAIVAWQAESVMCVHTMRV
eukprot:353689-Chlamydomonas_euryale.AAC.1